MNRKVFWFTLAGALSLTLTFAAISLAQGNSGNAPGQNPAKDQGQQGTTLAPGCQPSGSQPKKCDPGTQPPGDTTTPPGDTTTPGSTTTPGTTPGAGTLGAGPVAGSEPGTTGGGEAGATAQGGGEPAGAAGEGGGVLGAEAAGDDDGDNVPLADTGFESWILAALGLMAIGGAFALRRVATSRI
jgi:hypothetical protein